MKEKKKKKKKKKKKEEEEEEKKKKKEKAVVGERGGGGGGGRRRRLLPATPPLVLSPSTPLPVTVGWENLHHADHANTRQVLRNNRQVQHSPYTRSAHCSARDVTKSSAPCILSSDRRVSLPLLYLLISQSVCPQH